MNVLVTGGTGFIGSVLVPQLVAKGHRVGVLAQRANERIHWRGTGPAPEYQVLEGPLDAPEKLQAAVKAFAPDAVVHLAAIALVTHHDQAELYRVNTLGTETLLKVLIDGAKPGLPVMLVSTAGVYGNQVEERLVETMVPMPANHYALSKLAMEHIARQYADQLAIRVVRPFNMIGVGQDPRFIVPKLVQHFAKRAPTIELGNLKPERDYLDVEETARLMVTLLEQPWQGFDVVNLCSGAGTSVEALLEALTALTGHQIEVKVSPAFVRRNEVFRMIGDVTKLERLVGRPVRTSLDAVLRDMLEHARSSAA